MKAHLTENGVLTLYNLNSQSSAKVQVIYMTRWNTVSFIRVTDSKHLSPIMAIVKMQEKFIVGDIILIKKVQLQPASVYKDEEILPFLDIYLNTMIILEYQVMEKKEKIGVLFSLSNSNSIETSYWNSLSLIKKSLIKGDPLAQSIFKKSEKRLQLLRSDCNLLRERGNELFKKQNFCKAILHYDMAKQKDHYDARVWNNSSQAYFSNHEYDKARRDALVALKLDPFNKKAYYRAGRAMEKAGDIKGALEIIEAGLYVCGKCEDMEKLLKQIKDSQKINLEDKEDDPPTTNISEPKKKIINGQTGVVNLSEPPPTNNANKKNITPKESSQKKNKEKEVESSKSDKEPLKNQSRTPTLSFLAGAKMLFEKGKYKNALELMEAAKLSWVNNNQKEVVVLNYLIDVCKIRLKVDPIEPIKNNLLQALSKDTFPFPPALHYWLANIYELLENQDKVVYHANGCLKSLEAHTNPYCLIWPGTTELITETSPDELKKWFNVGTWRSAPLAKCRHPDCISIQNNSLAKQEIYLSDLDFRGYVEIECEELCSICYHPCCWKSIKEQNEGGQPGKKTEKEFLDLPCLTPDCSGKISCIRILDGSSQPRNEFAKFKKEKKTTNSKPKKQKDKKKSGNSGGKQDESKKLKGVDLELSKLENDLEIVQEETAIKKSSAEKPQVIDQKHFDSNNYKVLKPNEHLDEFAPQQPTKKNKKKKKKGKQVTQLTIGDDIEDRFVHNEYLTRLRSLKAQREAFESEVVDHQSSSIGRLKYLPECVLDPEKPFYLPQHLQENPAQLESILRAKMVTMSSSDIDKESIVTLLEFMYDWLKAQSPILITDSRIKNYISENFPPNAVSYVNKCGGVRHFLLQSFRFALIDEVICVNEQVVSAQEIAVQIVLDKFKTTKFLVSDGLKAVKLSHLLDDAKSTCSSNSSLSAPLLSTPASHLSNGLGSPPNMSPQPLTSSAVPAPSYKNVALGKTQKENESNTSKVNTSSPKLEDKKSKPVKLMKKSKLKTMDIDAFEVIEFAEMGKLFTPPTTTANDKVSKGPISKELFFHSDDEVENDIAPLEQASGKVKEDGVVELKERIASLESELTSKKEQLSRMAEEKEILVTQNQDLNNRFSQVKIKLNLEINNLKKVAEDAEEEMKVAKSNLEAYKNQKEGEVRKLLSEKVHSQEEMKAYSMKLDSLQLTNDQLKASKAQFEEEVDKKCIELTEMQSRMINFQNSAEVLNERARDAESKYLSMKRDLIKLNLEKTKKRLTAEVNKMYELRLETTDMTYPSKSVIALSIKEWEETITKLNNTLQTVSEDGQKLLDCIQLGRPLNALPPGDLQIPSVPDLTVAHLLFVGKNSDVKQVSFDKMNSASTSNGFLGLNAAFSTSGPSISHSQFGGLPSVAPFSLGQLVITPSIGASPRDNSQSSQMGGSSAMGPSHLGVNPSLGANQRVSSSLGTSHLGGVNLLDSHQFEDNNRLNENNVIGSASGLSNHRILHPHRIGDVPLGLGIGGHTSSSRLSENPSGFNINGATSSLSNLIGENLGKGGSSNSSPIPVPMPPMTSLSAGCSDFASGYPMRSKTPISDSNQLFVGQLPWDFTENHLKAVFSKYDVVAAVIHDKGNTNDGKPVPKCGFVTFRSQQERDRALQAGPINYGNHTLNIQAKDVKRAPKPIPPPPPAVPGPVPDLPLIPPSSTISSLSHPSSSQPSSWGSAFGLQSLREASSRSEPRTVATPTTPTATKPKFQNLRTNSNIGAIGTLPPKVVRPTPRPGNPALGVTSQSLQAMKEEPLATSAAYKRLTEAFKRKFGNEYPIMYIHKAIKEVREQNKNSLSGLTLDAITEQVEAQLRMHKRLPTKPSVAPWAQLPQTDVQSQGSARKSESISEDQCAICLEMLNSAPTMRLQCEHMFHIECIKNWFLHKSDCPICRKFALNMDEYPSLSHG